MNVSSVSNGAVSKSVARNAKSAAAKQKAIGARPIVADAAATASTPTMESMMQALMLQLQQQAQQIAALTASNGKASATTSTAPQSALIPHSDNPLLDLPYDKFDRTEYVEKDVLLKAGDESSARSAVFSPPVRIALHGALSEQCPVVELILKIGDNQATIANLTLSDIDVNATKQGGHKLRYRGRFDNELLTIEHNGIGVVLQTAMTFQGGDAFLNIVGAKRINS